MHVIHSHNGRRADEHTARNVSFFISNKKGGYLALGERSFTHMQGLFFFDEADFAPYKTVENIRLDQKMVSIRNSFAAAERVYENASEETFSMFNNTLFYSVKNYTGKIVLDLDFRSIFDYDDKGRIYSVTKEDDYIIIRYDKYSDDSLSTIARTRYLVVKGASNCEAVDAWEKKNYSYDEKRGSKSEFYTYKAIAIPVSGNLNLVFSFGKTVEEAKVQAKLVFDNENHYLTSMKKYMNHTFDSHDLSLDIASKALDDLLVSVDIITPSSVKKRTGVFAGLPWFYQFWSRDEIISLRAVMLQGKYPLVKTIIMNYLDALSEEGILPNRLPHSEVKSLDASGWLFVRIHDFLLELIHKKILDKHLDEVDVKKIKSKLENAILGITHHHVKDGFIVGGLQESWMDTKEAKRSGAFIESQTFVLAMMRLHNELALATKSKQLFIHMEKEYAEKIKSAFFKDGKLCDSLFGELSDDISRPNIFLAYYIYPALLSKEEWKAVFDNAIKDLWLDWGGFATISHNTPYFKVEYTGQDDSSYHNGDSWYYLNNYAAIAMLRLDRDYYWKYINRIIHASKEELLFSGFIGCAAEVSSAKELRSEGCLSQAWSAATYVELMHELKEKSK